MAKNITLMGADYPNVPAVQLPQTGGGTATFYEADEIIKTGEPTVPTGGLVAGGTFSIADYLDSKGITISLRRWGYGDSKTLKTSSIKNGSYTNGVLFTGVSADNDTARLTFAQDGTVTLSSHSTSTGLYVDVIAYY